MADARNVLVWSNHALEQNASNPEPHEIQEDYCLRRWLLGLEGVKQVLDFGCGGGLWRNLFEGFDYTGFDQNFEMIAQARIRHPNEVDNFTSGDWKQTPFAANYFDLVFTSAVLQHNWHRDKGVVLQELTRIIRPGGFLMCTENTFSKANFRATFPTGPFHEDLYNGYSYTKSGWERCMAQFNLILLKYQEPSEYLYQLPERE